MNESEIRDAVKNLEGANFHGRHIKVLIDLATRYLEVDGVMSDIYQCRCGGKYKYVVSVVDRYECGKCGIYMYLDEFELRKKVISDCTLAITKEKALSDEHIENLEFLLEKRNKEKAELDKKLEGLEDAVHNMVCCSMTDDGEISYQH